MPEYICHNDGKYNIFGTISDGFHFEQAITIGQLEHHIKRKFGECGLKKLQERLERAHSKGCSSLHHNSLEELLICNRAGENEEELTYDECIKRFLT